MSWGRPRSPGVGFHTHRNFRFELTEIGRITCGSVVDAGSRRLAFAPRGGPAEPLRPANRSGSSDCSGCEGSECPGEVGRPADLRPARLLVT